jgi:serine-type D-Ala-D-Ala carboxypeptidase/endopeptidase (penicillin-binding protein 4)
MLGGVLACLPGLGHALADEKPRNPQPVLPKPVKELIEASGLPLASFGLHVQQIGRAAKPLVSLNAETPFQMASTTKLVTSLAALDLLGPEYRWHTHAFLGGTLHEQRLLGDLIIVGGGDASLSSDALRAWFAEMQERGVQEVWGDIVLDRFAFSLSEGDHAWTPRPAQHQPGYARPDAFTLDEGVLRVALQAAPRRAAAVHLTPRQPGLRVLNQLTAGKGCSASAFLEQRAAVSQLVVRGEWAAACGDRQIAQLAVPHAELTSRAVAELWRECGGRFKGRVRSRVERQDGAGLAPGQDGAAPEPWASHASQPLPALIREINKTSDNLAARSLFLSLVDRFPAQPATLPAARARAEEWLGAQGLAEDDIAVHNGSGVSRAERGKPRALVQLLRNAWQGPHSQVFFDSLPIAGVDGTLARRMVGGAAAGRAHLKTGTGGETRALAGYVRCPSGRTHAVAAFVNHADAASAIPALDSVIEWLAANG